MRVSCWRVRAANPPPSGEAGRDPHPPVALSITCVGLDACDLRYQESNALSPLRTTIDDFRAQAVRMAKDATLARRLGVVVMSDASDVVAAGATGDSTHLVRALLEDGEGLTAYASIRDPDLCRALADRRIGDEVHVRVGGKLDPSRCEPLEVDAVIAENRVEAGHGRRMVLDLDPPAHVARSRAGKVRFVVTEGPPFTLKPSFCESMGLRIRDADVVVVKSFFPFRIFFLPYARKTIYVRTRGLTDLDAAFGLEFDGPVHPRDRVEGWREADRRRRA